MKPFIHINCAYLKEINIFLRLKIFEPIPHKSKSLLKKLGNSKKNLKRSR